MARDFDPKNCSAAQASKIIGVDRNTMTKWLEEGAPFIEKHEGNKPWVLSVPDLIKWKIEVEKSRAVESAIKKLSPTGTVDGAIEAVIDAEFVNIDEAKRRKAVADAQIREIQLHKEAGTVVPIEDVTVLVAREYNSVREGILGIGPRVAPRIVGQSDAAVIADEIRRAVDDCLSALNADRKRKWVTSGPSSSDDEGEKDDD